IPDALELGDEVAALERGHLGLAERGDEALLFLVGPELGAFRRRPRRFELLERLLLQGRPGERLRGDRAAEEPGAGLPGCALDAPARPWRGRREQGDAGDVATKVRERLAPAELSAGGDVAPADQRERDVADRRPEELGGGHLRVVAREGCRGGLQYFGG